MDPILLKIFFYGLFLSFKLIALSVSTLIGLFKFIINLRLFKTFLIGLLLSLSTLINFSLSFVVVLYNFTLTNLKILSISGLILSYLYYRYKIPKFVLLIKDQDGGVDKKIKFEMISVYTREGSNRKIGGGLKRLEIKVKVQVFENSYFNYLTGYYLTGYLGSLMTQFDVTLPEVRILPVFNPYINLELERISRHINSYKDREISSNIFSFDLKFKKDESFLNSYSLASFTSNPWFALLRSPDKSFLEGFQVELFNLIKSEEENQSELIRPPDSPGSCFRSNLKTKREVLEILKNEELRVSLLLESRIFGSWAGEAQKFLIEGQFQSSDLHLGAHGAYVVFFDASKIISVYDGKKCNEKLFSFKSVAPFRLEMV